MPQYDYIPPGTNGTAVTSTNINDNTVTGTLQFQTLGSGVTLTTVKDAIYGDGLALSATTGGAAGRVDTIPVAGGDNLMAFSCVIETGSATPTAGSEYLALGRNVNATVASSGNVQLNTSNQIEFRNAPDAVATAAAGNAWGSPTTARTIALTNGAKNYKIDLALVLNTFATPSTTNGRIIGRVVALDEPNWISTGVNEFWFDSGYTANVTADKTNLFRIMKAIATAATSAFKMKKIRWRSSATPNTGTNGTAITKANSILNFVQDVGPTIETTHSGAHYVIEAKATTGVGPFTYDITQTSGTVTTASTPVVMAPGFWRVDQSATEALGYHYTVTDTGNGNLFTEGDVSVPQAAANTSGTYGIKRRSGGAWLGA